MTKLLHLPTSPQPASLKPRRANPLPMALSLAMGSLRVSWDVRRHTRRGRLALIWKILPTLRRSWRLARRAWL